MQFYWTFGTLKSLLKIFLFSVLTSVAYRWHTTSPRYQYILSVLDNELQRSRSAKETVDNLPWRRRPRLRRCRQVKWNVAESRSNVYLWLIVTAPPPFDLFLRIFFTTAVNLLSKRRLCPLLCCNTPPCLTGSGSSFCPMRFWTPCTACLNTLVKITTVFRSTLLPTSTLTTSSISSSSDASLPWLVTL